MKPLNNILGSVAGEQRIMSKEAKKLVSRWQKTGLLEGITDQYERAGLAQLLENQAKQLINEASRTGTTEGSEEWAGVALPLVRRVFTEIASKDFVSVQPMSLPSGLVFYLDFKYGTAQPGFTTGAGNDSQADSVFGVTDTSNDANGGLYGAGRFGYTINDVTSSAITPSTLNGVSTSTTFQSGALASADYNYNTLFSQSYAGKFDDAQDEIYKITIQTSSLTNPDINGARAYKISGSGIVTYFPEFTKVSGNGDGTQITFVVSGSTPVNAVISYHKQPTDTTRGDFEDGKTQEATIDIPELNIEMQSDPITAKTRKLKAVWTPEFAQDLNAYHALDAEAELTSMLSEYISHEIDLEILDMLLKGAKTTGNWSAKVGREWNGSSFGNLSTIQAQASSYTKKDWYETLGITIQDVSNTIHQKTLRGGANFMVVSPKVATILESLGGFTADNTHDATANQFAFGVKQVGTYNGTIQVYKNPYFFQNQILMGYRGSQFLETGAVYAPYVPLVMTPMVLDPDTFTPRKGVMTRYAKKLVRPEFYGVVNVEGLETIA